MAKTIKVIDLLNKIANGEEVPEKIKHNGTEYNLNEITGWYQRIDEIGAVNEWFISKYRLNDKVEILEEQQDINIQNIKPASINYVVCNFDFENGHIKDILNKFFIENQKQHDIILQAVKQLDKDINAL